VSLDYAELARLGTATVYEAMGQRGLVDGEWRQVIPGSRVAGPARTARCGQGDNLMAHELLTRVRPGDVLVLTMPQPAPFALVGDLMVTQAKAQGVAGLLVDAAVRDLDALLEIGLPIWTRYVSMRGTRKEVTGPIDEPVIVGCQVISAGDLLILDSDGVTVIGAEFGPEALSKALDREAKEDTAREQIVGGGLTHDIFGFRGNVDRSDLPSVC
jgi:4-hydroxy-4-methyl-2-oxoglutarate aldolase